MEQHYYSEYSRYEREHWWFLVRNKLILIHLKKVTKDWGKLKILNIGAATGHTSELLSELGDVMSVEYDRGCCDFIRSQLKTDVLNASILELPFKNETFDLVCALDVIEHVGDDYLAITELKRVVKKSGIVSITVPAFMFLWSSHDTINRHFRRYRMKQIVKLFGTDGEIIYRTYLNFFLFVPIALFRILSRPFAGTEEKKPPVSDFSRIDNSLIREVLYKIFDLESIFISNAIRLPYGVSLLLSWKMISERYS